MRRGAVVAAVSPEEVLSLPAGSKVLEHTVDAPQLGSAKSRQDVGASGVEGSDDEAAPAPAPAGPATWRSVRVIMKEAQVWNGRADVLNFFAKYLDRSKDVRFGKTIPLSQGRIARLDVYCVEAEYANFVRKVKDVGSVHLVEASDLQKEKEARWRQEECFVLHRLTCHGCIRPERLGLPRRRASNAWATLLR